MSGEQVYVSHAPADLGLVQELFSTVKNFPFGVHIALEEVESGRSRKRLEGRLANCDVVVAVLTQDQSEYPWIHQEVGYAYSKGVPIIPVVDDQSLLRGYLEDLEGVAIDRDNPTVTVFNLLSRLRAELAPLGAMSVPNWYVQFPCNLGNCGNQVILDLEEGQTNLWKLHEHGRLLDTTCDVCNSTYYFDPATVGFVRREDGT